jgi:Carboxypeptidase regulatory-like domain/TonB-dependent Receptor Plug Domain
MIDAIVTDTSLRPLEGTAITIVGTSLRVVTGENGHFQFLALPAGRYNLFLQRLGYRPLIVAAEVRASDTIRVYYALANATQVLAGVNVTANTRTLRMAEFDQRRTTSVGGQFLTAAEIDKRNTVFATELVRMFRGITVKQQSNANGISEYFAVSGRGSTPGESGSRGIKPAILGCPIEVHVDGVRMSTPFSLDQLPSPKDLAGIEYYAGPASTPPQFGGVNRRCGVIMVWTKDGSVSAPAP